MFNLRFSDLFNTSNLQLGSGFTVSQILINILLAMAGGLLISVIYKKTYSGVLYSKNIGITLVLVSVITSLIVMTISGNLALSLGMVGALSIVRFRTPIKDPRDLAFLFWSIANGVICGISAYKMAIISLVLLSVLLVLLTKKMNWSSSPYLLVLKLAHFDQKAILAVLNQNCHKAKERSSSISEKGSELIYEIKLKEDNSSALLQKLKALPGVQQALMVSYEGELDEAR